MKYLVILDCELGECKIFPMFNNSAEHVAADNSYNLDDYHWMVCNKIEING